MNGQPTFSEKIMKPQTVNLIIAFSMLVAVGTAQAECAPSLIGSPCKYGGIASASPAEPGLTLAAGNPIHLVTGNKYQHDIDLPPNPTAPGLELIRHYNAMDPRRSVLGQGWALSYDTRLYRTDTGWQIVQADGSRIDFPAASARADGTHQNRHGRLDHVNGHHNWFWSSGTILRFDDKGYLVAIRWPSGESVYISRHEAGSLKGSIQAVHNERSQTMSFHYSIVDDHARLTAVDTPAGRFSYYYDQPHTAPRLTRVVRPDAMERHYLHEPERQGPSPYALTGIELVSPDTQKRQRTNTWSYDAQGRAITSTSTDTHNRTHRLELDYQRAPSTQQPGLSIVSDGLQRRTRFHTALRGGRYVLTAVHGDGCPGCAAPGTRADYDDQGRLSTINGTQIKRTPDGTIQTIQPARSGWPGLTLHYNGTGLRDHWHSATTGTEHMRYGAHGLPIERRFANGDTTTMKYDVQHRPVKMVERHGDAQTTTQLHWHGHRLTRIEHPAETEQRHYDSLGRVTAREITRNADQGTLQIKEQFSYDAMHRMTRHDLPEGGSLQYQWGQSPQLKAIYWQDINGSKHTIIETRPGQPGYTYGNDLHLYTAADSDHLIRELQLRHQDQLIWAQELSYDSHHRISTEHIHTNIGTAAPQHSASRYAYDDQSRLIGHRHAQTPGSSWHAWHADGSAAAVRADAVTIQPAIQRDASGLALHSDGYDLSYSAGRRLQSVSRAGKQLAQYRHNAFGYRISRQDANAQRSDYFYLNNQRVAQAIERDHTGTPANEPGITRRYVYAHHVPVAVIDYSAQHPTGLQYFVHADLQGAPRLMTDLERRVRWHTDYSALGQAVNLSGDMQLDLRLPGQIADHDTGWHDNLLRTYQPQWGHYLEPDPLGPVPGNQAYGYASQQPRRYADPMGLLLFAFDGTRQTADTQSNIWKMSQYYLDGPVLYHPGPGNSAFINWDAVTAHEASQIIETQWKWLLYELSRPQAATEITPIDILGFSRGAALARHFGNMIAQHVNQGLFQFNDPFFGSISACVDLRFMGLFDTVTQFGIAGSQNHNYDLSIAAAWEWVAHAVALHERRWLFPLTSARSTHADNVVEAPFIGAHADIGGGVLPASRGKAGGRGDLSNVTLNWMLWQARAASVPLAEAGSDDTTINQPIVHDFRSPAIRTVQDGDRRVDSADGQRGYNYQDDHPHLGRTSRTQTERFIERHDNWRREAGVEAGIVDMDGYAQWLHDELGWHALPV